MTAPNMTRPTNPTIDPRSLGRVSSCLRHNVPLRNISDYCGISKAEVAAAVLKLKGPDQVRKLLLSEAEAALGERMENAK